MAILELIVSYFLKPQGGICIAMTRIAGYLFLLCGGGFGLYFLFQALIPLIGFVASGACISALLMAVGGTFLFYARKKKPSRPLDNVFEGAQDLIKNVDIEEILKNNIHKVILFSFLGGLALSQIKNVKKLGCLKDKLSILKDFLR